MVKARSSTPKMARLKTSDEMKELVEFVELVASLMLDLHEHGSAWREPTSYHDG